MKKFLLLSCAFAAFVSANAQQLQQLPMPTPFTKAAPVEAAKVFQQVDVAKKSPAKIGQNDFVGIFINSSFDHEVFASTADTIRTANVQDPETGETYNVEWGVYGNQLGSVYGKFDEATNTLTVPGGQYTGQGNPIEIADGESSPVVFLPYSTNGNWCDLVATYDEASQKLVLQDSIAGYYFFIAEGTYANYWAARCVTPVIAKANGVQTGYRTSNSSWIDFECPIYMDLSLFEDGMVDVYNVYPGTKLTVEIDGAEAFMSNLQPMIYGSSDELRNTYGEYACLTACDVDADGNISLNKDEYKYVEGTYDEESGIIAFDGQAGLYGIWSDIVEGQGYGAGYYQGVNFTPMNGVIDAVKGVKNTVEKSSDNRIFNLAGQQVGKDYKGIVIQNGVKKVQK